MAIDSFWKIPDVSKIKTPVSILKEQAEALSRDTNGILLGFVDSSSLGSNDILLNFYIIVPVMNRFRVKILSYYQPITLYPGSMNNEVTGIAVGVTSEEDFVRVLRDTLGSDKINSIISSLLAQAYSTGK